MLIPDENKLSPGGRTTHIKRYPGAAVAIAVREDGTETAEAAEDSEGSSNFPHLTASRLVQSDAVKDLQSVADLTDWIATATANRVTVSDDGDGTITLSGPQDIDATASPTFVNITLTGGIVTGANSDSLAIGTVDNWAVFTLGGDTVSILSDGTNAGLVWSDGAMLAGSSESGVDAIFGVYGTAAKGILRVYSNGLDKYIDMYHDDTDGHIITSSGDLHLEPAGDVVLTTKGRVCTTTRATTTYQILVTDHIVFCNTDGSSWTATLPAGAEGQSLRVINSGSSSGLLTVAPSGAEHLLGVNSNFTLYDGEALELTYNGTDGWY